MFIRQYTHALCRHYTPLICCDLTDLFAWALYAHPAGCPSSVHVSNVSLYRIHSGTNRTGVHSFLCMCLFENIYRPWVLLWLDYCNPTSHVTYCLSTWCFSKCWGLAHTVNIQFTMWDSHWVITNTHKHKHTQSHTPKSPSEIGYLRTDAAQRK